MSTSTMNTMDCSPSVTFDSNVREVVLDDEKRLGDAAKRVFHALQSGIIKGFVARSYFAHDAIKRGGQNQRIMRWNRISHSVKSLTLSKRIRVTGSTNIDNGIEFL